MLRIDTEVDRTGRTVLRLEGSLIGPWIAEFLRVLEVVPAGAIAIDLAALVYADKDGARLVSDLISGDEDAFLRLVHREHASMIRYARLFVSTPVSAEEVVQEAWVGMLGGLARFEGRSSLRAWMLGIVANRARSCGVREGRSVPVSAPTEDSEEDATDPDRFFRP